MNKQQRLLFFLFFLSFTSSFAQPSSFGGEIVSYQTFGEGLMVTRAKIPALSGVVSNMFFFNRADLPWLGNEWYEYDWEIRGAHPNNGWSQIRVRPSSTTDFRDAPVNIGTTINISNSFLHWILIRKDNQYVYDIRQDFDINTYDYNNAGAHGGNSASLVAGGPRIYTTGGDVAHIPEGKQLDFSLGITAFDIDWTGPLPTGSYSADFVVDFTRFYGFSGNNLNTAPQWRDEFNFLDFSKWQVANWDFFDTQFTQNNIRFEDGKMMLTASRSDGVTDNGNENLALNGTATQSSTSNGGIASRAIDNNTSGVWSQGSVTHTADAINSWWQVDLRQDADINRIEIFNRTDCCVDRLADFSVSVLDANDQLVWHRFYANPPNSSLTINVDTRGRKVRVNLDGTLSLAEVRVFGTGSGNIDETVDNGETSGNTGNQGTTTTSCDNGTSITYGNGSITMIGGAFYQIFDINWQEVFNCGWQCGNSQTAENLPAGDYRIFIKDNTYQTICEQVITLSAGNNDGTDTTDNSGTGDSENGEDSTTDTGGSSGGSEGGTTDTGSSGGNEGSTTCGGNTLITYGNGTIAMEGGSFYQILDANWQEVFNCGWQCGNGQTVENLPAGDYRVFIKDNAYQTICEQVITLSAGNSEGGSTSDNGGNDTSDNGGGTTETGGGDGNGTNTICGDVTITYGNGTVNFIGLPSVDYFFKINDLNNGWADAGSCGWNCGNEFIVNNLANSRYLLTIYNDDWSVHCDTEITMTGSSAAGSAENRQAAHLSFVAYQAKRGVDLQWLTNSGFKVSDFAVEHSNDGENFQEIATSINKDWSNEIAYHQSIDEQPANGANYYRIKEIYLDGSFAYTNIQQVDFSIDLESISVFPNPAQAELFVNVRSLKNNTGTIILSNQFGQVVQEIRLAEINEDIIPINTEKMSNGLYYLQLAIDGKKMLTKKVFIQRLY